MGINTFIAKLTEYPEKIEFPETMTVIDAHYNFTPTSFSNGDIVNDANKNNGSCKIFSFGQLNNLSVQQVLSCFGSYYRDDVLDNPDGDNHQNIRQFMLSGWNSIKFKSPALKLK